MNVFPEKKKQQLVAPHLPPQVQKPLKGTPSLQCHLSPLEIRQCLIKKQFWGFLIPIIRPGNFRPNKNWHWGPMILTQLDSTSSTLPESNGEFTPENWMLGRWTFLLLRPFGLFSGVQNLPFVSRAQVFWPPSCFSSFWVCFAPALVENMSKELHDLVLLVKSLCRLSLFLEILWEWDQCCCFFKVGGWTNPFFKKICSSNWIVPKVPGDFLKNLWNHQLVKVFFNVWVIILTLLKINPRHPEVKRMFWQEDDSSGKSNHQHFFVGRSFEKWFFHHFCSFTF